MAHLQKWLCLVHYRQINSERTSGALLTMADMKTKRKNDVPCSNSTEGTPKADSSAAQQADLQIYRKKITSTKVEVSGAKIAIASICCALPWKAPSGSTATGVLLTMAHTLPITHTHTRAHALGRPTKNVPDLRLLKNAPTPYPATGPEFQEPHHGEDQLPYPPPPGS
jgi:hypothetical protein